MFRKCLVASIAIACIAAVVFQASIVSACERTVGYVFSDDGETMTSTRTRTFHRNCHEVTIERTRTFSASCDSNCDGGRHRSRTVTREASCDGSCAK